MLSLEIQEVDEMAHQGQTTAGQATPDNLSSIRGTYMTKGKLASRSCLYMYALAYVQTHRGQERGRESM